MQKKLFVAKSIYNQVTVQFVWKEIGIEVIWFKFSSISRFSVFTESTKHGRIQSDSQHKQLKSAEIK